jgi:hypothetical protein
MGVRELARSIVRVSAALDENSASPRTVASGSIC